MCSTGGQEGAHRYRILLTVLRRRQSWLGFNRLALGCDGSARAPDCERRSDGSMDSLCFHHDAAYRIVDVINLRKNFIPWYPEPERGVENLCVVSYGLVNAKLTEDGILVDKDEEENWTSRNPNLSLDALHGTIYRGGPGAIGSAPT